jgi:hypothetical protein
MLAPPGVKREAAIARCDVQDAATKILLGLLNLKSGGRYRFERERRVRRPWSHCAGTIAAGGGVAHGSGGENPHYQFYLGATWQIKLAKQQLSC